MPETYKMTTRATTEPKVGIFWLLGGKVIADGTPLSQAAPYGEARTDPRGHLKRWTELQKAGQVPPEIEYDDPPRGRAVYYPRDEEFCRPVHPAQQGRDPPNPLGVEFASKADEDLRGPALPLLPVHFGRTRPGMRIAADPFARAAISGKLKGS